MLLALAGGSDFFLPLSCTCHLGAMEGDMLIQKMLHLDRVRVHKSWEDMVTAVLSLALIASLFWQIVPLPATTSASVFLAGGAIFTVAVLEIMFFGRWEEYLQLVLGGWVALAVFVLDYGIGGELRVWHFVIGTLIALIAIFEIWQDFGKAK